MCLLRLLRDKLWFLSPRSHFLIGAQWVMTFWWLNMETGCKCLSLSSCWPQLVQLLSCWEEIQCTLFNAFCHSSHSISYFGLWQGSPLPGTIFSPTAREPLTISHLSPSEDGDTFCWFTSCLTGKRATYGSWHCWQTILRWSEGAGRPDSCVRWGLQRISAGAVSVLCVPLFVHRMLPWQWWWFWFALR